MVEPEKQKIISSFEKNEKDYWKTVGEISKLSGVPPSDILKIIRNSCDFVRSSYRTRHGQPVFPTRRLFRKKATIVDQMIGAFKNRID